MAKATATKKIETVAGDAQKAMSDGVEKMTKGFESAAAFGQDNVEAVVESSKIAAKVAENMTAEIAAYSKMTYDDGMAAAKELATCKSVTEFFEKQTAFTKVSVETYFGEATKLNDMYTAAAKDIFAPLTARFTAASDAVKDFRA